MNRKLYVSNLAWQVTDEELAMFFGQAGEVVNAAVIINRDTGRSRGFGFVEMKTEEEAAKALAEMAGANWKGRAIVVKEALPERSSKSGDSEAGQLADFLQRANLGDEMDVRVGYSLVKIRIVKIKESYEEKPGMVHQSY